MNTYNGCMLKHFIFLAQVFIKFKDGGHITTPVNCESQWWNRIERRSSPVAIIGSTPNCDNCLIKHELESIHGKLMCSGDEVDGIVVCETFRDVSAKQKPGTARRETPSRNILGVWEIMGGEAILCAYRRGRTIKDRTWLRREGLPVFYR